MAFETLKQVILVRLGVTELSVSIFLLQTLIEMRAIYSRTSRTSLQMKSLV
jgi:hypothetical protein